MRTRGLFIVLEGIDGAGTTTQSGRLAARLRAMGRAVHVTNEPSGGPIGALLRQVLRRRIEVPGERAAEAMALLFAADRLDHVASEVEPALARGDVVISDRYDLSSLAYQSLTSEGATRIPWIRELNRFARRPDVTVVVDVTPDEAARRRGSRGGPADLYELDELQRRLAAAYLDAEALVPGDTLVHVDGDASADAVAEAIFDAVARRLQ